MLDEYAARVTTAEAAELPSFHLAAVAAATTSAVTAVAASCQLVVVVHKRCAYMPTLRTFVLHVSVSIKALSITETRPTAANSVRFPAMAGTVPKRTMHKLFPADLVVNK